MVDTGRAGLIRIANGSSLPWDRFLQFTPSRLRTAEAGANGGGDSEVVGGTEDRGTIERY